MILLANSLIQSVLAGLASGLDRLRKNRRNVPGSGLHLLLLVIDNERAARGRSKFLCRRGRDKHVSFRELALKGSPRKRTSLDGQFIRRYV